ncbi:MAG: PspA/IM30 family protein [Chloroflexi bacterium]|nr:PspA/IM30 family protein [Chloroflexota bacterium]
MSILDRVANILRANINDLLDQAEDPEKMLNQISRDMAEAVQEAKAQVIETAAQENLLRSNLEKSRELAAQWQEKAELAVEKGRDDLAREALRRKRDYQSNGSVYETQLTAQHQMVEKLKTDLKALESKYGELQRNREILIARHKVAEAQRKIQKTFVSASSIDFTSELGRMEEKIRLEEARASASADMTSSTLDAQLEALSSGPENEEIEEELQSIKTKRSQN